MRKRFEAQMILGSIPIDLIQIPTKCRDEMPGFLRAMQYIYCNQEVSEQVYSLLESVICTKKPTGRPGMDLWTIFVLAGARLCLNADYDRLHYISNTDNLLRQILGVQDGFLPGRDFDRQTIIDNVQLLDDETLKKINQIIVDTGHRLVKKKETEALLIKIDSFVTESNVHFPTDYNLLWDSARKCLDTIEHLIKRYPDYNVGWRKIKNWHKRLKSLMLKVGRATADKSKNRADRLVKTASEYLQVARLLLAKLSDYTQINPQHIREKLLLEQLKYYYAMLDKHIDLVDRRLLKGEVIPQDEKIFSIFEPWTEWICKGKSHKLVELGKRTCIATDQWHFIVDWCVSDHQQDSQLLIPFVDKIREYYKNVSQVSCDKGFYSKFDVELLKIFDINPIIPKKGRLSQADIQRENDPAFIKAKRAHSAVESNINELEHRGLDRCPDKGLLGFHRYVGLGVIAYNLHKIGNILLEQDRQKAKNKLIKQQLAA